MKANTEAGNNRKGSSALYFNIGLTISLAVIVTAFEWRTEMPEPVVDMPIDGGRFVTVTEIPVTAHPVSKPIPKINLESKNVTVEAEVEKLVSPKVESVTMIVPKGTPAVTGGFIESIPVEKPDSVFNIVESPPSPVGGMEEFYGYLYKNIKYPRRALKSEIEGRVFITFVVERDGHLTDIVVSKGIGFGCDEEAERVLATAPKWNPGKQRGNPVRVRMTLPVNFRIKS